MNVKGEEMTNVTNFYKEAHPYYRQRVVIVGGKNSAAEAALEIHRAGGYVTMVHRGPGFGESVKYWVKPDIENRVKEGSITAHFSANVTEIRPTEVVLNTGVTIPAEAVLLRTGYHADEDWMRQIGIEIHPDTRAPKVISMVGTMRNLVSEGLQSAVGNHCRNTRWDRVLPAAAGGDRDQGRTRSETVLGETAPSVPGGLSGPTAGAGCRGPRHPGAGGRNR